MEILKSTSLWEECIRWGCVFLNCCTFFRGFHVCSTMLRIVFRSRIQTRREILGRYCARLAKYSGFQAAANCVYCMSVSHAANFVHCMYVSHAAVLFLTVWSLYFIYFAPGARVRLPASNRFYSKREISAHDMLDPGRKISKTCSIILVWRYVEMYKLLKCLN